jgi:predicted transcriptional regulator
MQRIAVMPQSVLEMTKDLVLGQIQSGTLTPEDMQEALRHIYQELRRLQSREESELSVADMHQTPSDWRKSITRHAVTCLECGASFKLLSVRHLRHHDLDGRTYRAKYGIPRTQPLAARATTARRKEVIQRTRPWEKTPTYAKAQEGKAAAAKKPGRKKTARNR